MEVINSSSYPKKPLAANITLVVRGQYSKEGREKMLTRNQTKCVKYLYEIKHELIE
ncbi:MAG: hypothetical protein ACOC1K_02620 [Nanoarchaeota archaeon]